MKNLLAFALLAPAGAVLAQGPVITGLTPLANARAVPRNSAVTVSFNQPLAAGSAGALQVFGSLRGGRRTRATPAVVSGNTLSFAPSAHAYLPGEVVQYTVTTAATGTGGALAQARVGQFTAEVGGTGQGTFGGTGQASVGNYPHGLVLGDVDNDNDVDLVTADSNNGNNGTVSVRLNNSRGQFPSGSGLLMNGSPEAVALGDLDGDGDLDLAVGFGFGNAVAVRFNNGRGVFSGNQSVATGPSPVGVALGDVDGDGDLDLATANNFGGTTVSIRLNDGNGFFSGTQDLNVGFGGTNLVTLGDVDNDGDLDLVAAADGGSVGVGLNNGAGVFSGTQNVAVGLSPHGLALADVDGDGDLDFVTAHFTANTAGVYLNNGTGTFAVAQTLPTVGSSPLGIALGDVDADGDPDLLVAIANFNTGTTGTVNVCLNNGSGTFASPSVVNVTNSTEAVALGDLDADGDLDLLTANNTASGTACVRLNGGSGLGTAAARAGATLQAYPNPAHRTLTVVNAVAGVPILLLDALGRTLLTAAAAADGTAHLTLPTTLPTGVYVLRNGNQRQRLVVE